MAQKYDSKTEKLIRSPFYKEKMETLKDFIASYTSYPPYEFEDLPTPPQYKEEGSTTSEDVKEEDDKMSE